MGASREPFLADSASFKKFNMVDSLGQKHSLGFGSCGWKQTWSVQPSVERPVFRSCWRSGLLNHVKQLKHHSL
jgi:hypothetical protein